MTSNMNIDCSIPCFHFFRLLNSCPTKSINYFNPFNSEDIYELFMVGVSLTPYPTCFLILLSGSYFRTSRSVFILMMVFLQNFLVEMLKNNLRDPRPNYHCNQQFGNPSNHASFFTCLIMWFIMEYIFLEKKYQMKYQQVVFILFAFYPFIVYSRYYLHYHSIEQIINGIILGIFVGGAWFTLCLHVILPSDNALRKFLGTLQVKNTMSKAVISGSEYEEGNMKRNDAQRLNERYQMLLEKNNQLSKLKSDMAKLTNNVKNMDFMKEVNLEESKRKMKMDNQPHSMENYDNEDEEDIIEEENCEEDYEEEDEEEESQGKKCQDETKRYKKIEAEDQD